MDNVQQVERHTSPKHRYSPPSPPSPPSPSAVRRPPSASHPFMSPPPLFGLILAGGASTRMQRDKAALRYHGHTQLEWVHELLSHFCATTFVSVRPEQCGESMRSGFAQIVDSEPGIGPLAGISAALLAHPNAAWLVVACDLPFLTEKTLSSLLAGRDAQHIATAFRSRHDGLPEPLCAIWEPAARDIVSKHLAEGKRCPRKLLIEAGCNLLELPEPQALDNVNTTEELSAALAALRGNSAPQTSDSAAQASDDVPTPSSGSKSLRIQYFAILREQAGRSEEIVDTTAATPEQLYEELRKRHRFRLAPSQLKVALNSDFSDWRAPLNHGDTVVFIPPVAGG
jgi:molybdenum cofactor guanylyltransferase